MEIVLEVDALCPVETGAGGARIAIELAVVPAEPRGASAAVAAEVVRLGAGAPFWQGWVPPQTPTGERKPGHLKSMLAKRWRVATEVSVFRCRGSEMESSRMSSRQPTKPGKKEIGRMEIQSVIERRDMSKAKQKSTSL